jgi:hydroxypyruvate reductase
MDDDVSVIGSGPGVPDETTWADAAGAITRWGGSAHPVAVRERIAAGVAGKLGDTPKPGEPSVTRAQGHVVASRHDALEGAQRAATHLGYRVVLLPEPVTGEARTAADSWLSTVTRHIAAGGERLCVISAGETTVRVVGSGKGGRNQEFALALAARMHAVTRQALAASVGTDGIDGPTDAAGAFVDCTTLARAAQLGLSPPAVYLDQNNSFEFFDRLGDLIRTGPTDTNVGDLQIFLTRLTIP